MEITEQSQEALEKELRSDLAKIGFKIYAISTIPGGDEVYGLVIAYHKKLIEYFDNTRLLKNQPKDIVNL